LTNFWHVKLQLVFTVCQGEMRGQMWHHSTVTSEKVIIMTEVEWSNLKAIWYNVFQ